LLNFQTVWSCAEAPLAEKAMMPKTAAILMLHLLITSPRLLSFWGDVDASALPLQSLRQ
jgi:hypothetical protein